MKMKSGSCQRYVWLIAIVHATVLGVALAKPASAQAATTDRVWLASRYDAQRVMVYFNAGKFHNDTLGGREIPPPEASMVFPPHEMTVAQAASFRALSRSEAFKLGDHYDLLIGNGRVVMITLTTLIGYPGDEQTGNDSYLGALGTVGDADTALVTNSYFALRRHAAARRTPLRIKPTPATKNPGLVVDSLAPALRSELAALVYAGGKVDRDPSVRRNAAAGAPTFDDVRAFTLASGAQRYYVQSRYENDADCLLLDAFVASRPTLRLLTLGASSCAADAPKDHPALLGVVDLSDGRTGLVVQFPGVDGTELRLLEYKDGVGLTKMRTLWSISASE